MTAKHTPAPWTPHVAYDEHGGAQFCVDDGKPATREDMRLIAAAPDLAESVADLLYDMQSIAASIEAGHSVVMNVGTVLRIEKARAVLARLDQA